MTVHVSVRSTSGLPLPSIAAGRLIFQVERVEVNVALPPDTFTLKPSAASGQAQ